MGNSVNSGVDTDWDVIWENVLSPSKKRSPANISGQMGTRVLNHSLSSFSNEAYHGQVLFYLYLRFRRHISLHPFRFCPASPIYKFWVMAVGVLSQLLDIQLPLCLMLLLL